MLTIDSLIQQVDRLLEDRLVMIERVIPEHLSQIFRNYLSGGGKRIRPKLLLLCNRAFGGNDETALPAAAAIELYHTWVMIHDDGIDHDTVRRGRPTAHILAKRAGKSSFTLGEKESRDYGIAVAILAGDLIQGAALEMMSRLPNVSPDVSSALMSRMSGAMGRAWVTGEQLDIEMSHTPFEAITEEMTARMMAGKTGAMLRFSVEAGTAIGLDTMDDPRMEAMARFGHLWGISFQLQDDLLGIFGDESTLGKSVDSDIREGKRTLLAVRTLDRLGGRDRERFLQLYGRADMTQADVQEVRTLITRSGAEESTRRTAQQWLDEALALLMRTIPDSPARQELITLSQRMLTRNV